MRFRLRPVAFRRLLALILIAACVAAARANQAPTGTVRVNTTSIAAGQQVVVSVDATDADGNLHYINIDQISPTNGFYGPGDTGTQTPPNNGAYDLGGYFGSRTRDLTLTLNTPGTYVFRGAMNDDSGWHYTANTVSVTVTNANQPPSGTVRVNTTSIYAGQQVVVSVDATDANGNLHYINIDQTSPTNGFYGPGDTGTESPPNNGAYDLGGYFGSRTRDLTLNLNTPGTYVFRGAMNDDSGWYYTPNTVSVTVINPNQPPTGTVRVNTTSIYAGQQVIVSVDATDANGNLHYINIDQTSPTNGYYGPGDTGTQAPPNNGAYDLGGYFGSRTRNLTLTLNAAGTYVFRGAMNDDSGWNYTSNTVSVSVGAPPDTTPPGAPQNLLVSGLTNTGFTISWAAPSGEAAAGYRVRLDGGGFTDVGANTSHSFAGLAAGSSHAVEVQARDAASNWSISASYGVTTTTSGGGGTQTSDSNWVDVDNDGILDEVVRAGTEEFYYYVNQWSTANAQYAYVSINNFWEAFTVIWPPSWSWENFTMVWDYEPIFWVGYETSFDLTFEVMTGSNEPFAIYRDPSESPDITLSDWQLVAEHPGYVYGGLQIINYPLPNANFLPGAQFFLVKRGMPVGSVQFKDSAGNDLTENVAVNGTANLFLPANNQVTLNLFHNTGNAVSTAVHQVAWQIRDAVGNILRQGFGLNVDFDNLNLNLIAQVVILLDNAPAKSVNAKVLSIEKVWSDQIPGIPGSYINALPSYSLIYMAARTDGFAHINVETSGNLIPQALVGVRGASVTGILGSAPINSSITALTFNDYSTEFETVLGLDVNNDGTLQEGEVKSVFPGKIRVFSDEDYSAASLTLNGGGSSLSSVIFGRASEMLSAFLDDVAPTGATFSNDGVLLPGNVTHPVGMKWLTDATANTRRYTWADGSLMADDVEVNTALIAAMRTALGSHASEVNTYFSQNPSVESHTFTWTYTQPVNFDGLSLFNTFGNVIVQGSISVEVTRQDLVVTNATYSGWFEDVYDFNAVGGFPAQLAATVQTGFGGIGGVAGRVVRLKVTFSNTMPGATFGYQFPTNP